MHNFFLRTKVKFKNNHLFQLSNVLNFNDNFNLDVLINFVLIKKKSVCNVDKISCGMALDFLEALGGDLGDELTSGVEVDGCGGDGADFGLYFGIGFAFSNKSLALSPIML